MSKSFDMSVTLNFRVVFTEKDLSQLDALVAECAKALLDPETDPEGRGIAMAIIAASKSGHEEVLKTMLKQTAKEIRRVVMNEVPKENFKNFAPATTTITPRGEDCCDSPHSCCADCLKRFAL